MAAETRRWAAIRTDDGENEYVDVSTLAATDGDAWRLAERQDLANRKAIGRRERFRHLRIVRVRIIEEEETASMKPYQTEGEIAQALNP